MSAIERQAFLLAGPTASGKSAKAGKNIAVEGKSALVCEILSTALYAAPESSRADIIKNFEGYSFI